MPGLPTGQPRGTDVVFGMVAHHEDLPGGDAARFEPRGENAKDVRVGLAETVFERPETELGLEGAQAQPGTYQRFLQFAERAGLGNRLKGTGSAPSR